MCMGYPGSEVIKKFILNSAEHEILNAHKYKNINKVFSGSDKPRMLFFQLINVEMPTFVGILNIYEQENLMLS